MKIVQDYPPNIEKIRAAFTLRKGIIFTYGDTIYAPDGGEIGKALMRHEETHCKQQGDDPEAWWERYLIDPDWRVQQEIAAYRNQFKATRKLVLDRATRHAHLCKFALDLSSEIYGNAISFAAAFKAIKHERVL